MVQLNTLVASVATVMAVTGPLAVQAHSPPGADVGHGSRFAKRAPRPAATPKPQGERRQASRQAEDSGAFSNFSGSLPASISSIISTITSGTETNVAEPTPTQTYSAGAVNPSISNAPPLPAGEYLLIF